MGAGGVVGMVTLVTRFLRCSCADFEAGRHWNLRSSPSAIN